MKTLTLIVFIIIFTLILSYFFIIHRSYKSHVNGGAVFLIPFIKNLLTKSGVSLPTTIDDFKRLKPAIQEQIINLIKPAIQEQINKLLKRAILDPKLLKAIKDELKWTPQSDLIQYISHLK